MSQAKCGDSGGRCAVVYRDGALWGRYILAERKMTRETGESGSWRILVWIIPGILLICAAGAWVISYGPASADPPSFRFWGARYTLRNERGVVRVLGPPSHPQLASPAAWDFVAHLSNDQLSWNVSYQTIFPQRFGSDPKWFPGATTQGSGLNNADLLRPLLEALEDPKRFAAAHLWLDNRFNTVRTWSQRIDRDHLVAGYDGLEVTLRPSMLLRDRATLEAECRRNQKRGDIAALSELCAGPDALQISPEQLPKLRRLWHDRLDVQVLAIANWVLVTLPIVPLAISAMRFWRSRVMRAAQARGCCPVCGYDLRSGHERCPECGSPTPNPVLHGGADILVCPEATFGRAGEPPFAESVAQH
jgi:hypothetical protein